MGFEPKLITVITDVTILESGDDYTVLVDANAGDVTVTLPLITQELKGRYLVFKKIDSSDNLMILQPDASNTIDGQSNLIINTQYESVTLTNDGDTDWLIY